MDAAAIRAALLSARQSWVALPDYGAEVRIVRPPEAQFGKFVNGIDVEHVCAHVDGWRKFTEATLLGASVGADDPVDFSPELWADWVRDRVDVIQLVARALADSISLHLREREAVSGN